MLSRLWLRLSLRQLLRTLGQHRAFLPLLIIGTLTIPTAIVSVDQMAPHGHTVFYKMKQGASAKLVYTYLLIIFVLLFPLQLQLLQDLDKNRELENLERYPLPRRSIFHFKLIDQWVMFGPLLVVALLVTMAGGLYKMSHSRSEHLMLGGKGVKALADAGPSAEAKSGLEAALDRSIQLAEFRGEPYVQAELARLRERGVKGEELDKAEFVIRDKAAFLLATAKERITETVLDRAAERPPSTQIAFALQLWDVRIGRAIAHRPLTDDDVDDFVPLTNELWTANGYALPLSTPAQGVLILLLGLLAVWVQLMLMFGVTAGLGLVPRRIFGSRPILVALAVMGMIFGLAAIALLFPSSRFPARRQAWMPWVLVPSAVELVNLRHYREALVPIGFLFGYLALAYEFAGWSYQRHLLRGREELLGRLTSLMADTKEDLARRRRAWLDSDLITWLWGPAVALLVSKDVKQVTRPPVNRLMILLLGVPFGALALFVGLAILVGAPSPWETRPMLIHGKAAMMLLLYGGLTLFWIPCAQIFLFSYERWGVTAMWCGPFDANTIYRGKAVAATLLLAPAVSMAYIGMAMFISVGATPRIGLIAVAGLAFVGSTMAVFGSLVASLGFLFPYFLQNRFRHLAGGLGFMLQLSLLPAWLATWLFGALSIQYFKGQGLAILVAMLLIWAGFAYILSREARHAIGKIGAEYGRAGAKVDAGTDAAAAVAHAVAQKAADELTPVTESAGDVRRGRTALQSAGWWWGYCLNVHPTETLEELHAALDTASLVRERVNADQDQRPPLGVELRLGAPAIEALDDAALDALSTKLANNRLIAFSCNGFPLSPFTSGTVKQQVYRPDWTEPDRGRLTLLLARAMVRLAPVAVPQITISTVAGAFRPERSGPDARDAMIAQLRATADALADLEQETGRRVVLCLEPEPFTTLETTPEAVAFFARLYCGSRTDADRWRRHLALNLDVCHQAVVFERLPASLDAITAAGVPIGKVHISAALRLPSPTAADLEQLARYDEPRYLHQTFVRHKDASWDTPPSRHVDLGPFIESADPSTIDELRTHFHVPLHEQPEGALSSTADDAVAALEYLLCRQVCRVAALETYTWNVLVERGLADDVVEGIARELRWFAARAGEHAPPSDTRRIHRLIQ